MRKKRLLPVREWRDLLEDGRITDASFGEQCSNALGDGVATVWSYAEQWSDPCSPCWTCGGGLRATGPCPGEGNGGSWFVPLG